MDPNLATNSPATALTQPLAWHHFQFRLPADWELTGFVAKVEKGRLEFSTRRGLQGQVYWRNCDAKPNLGRIMDEIHRRYLHAEKDQPTPRFRSLQRCSPGRFLFGCDRPGRPCHAAIYLPETHVLLQWLFPRYDPDAAEAIVKPLLATFQPNDGQQQRWAILGLDFQLPRALKLVKVDPYPANVSLAFEGKRRPRVTLRRWGLAPLLLKGKAVRAFYHRFVATLGRVVSIEDVPWRGCPGAEAHFEQRAERALQKLTGRWWPGRALAWHDIEAMRLYAFEQVGPRRWPKLDPSDVLPQAQTPAAPAASV